jgi:ketosteroid isomerase-like protein
MSEENVEVIRRAFEAWNAGDIDGMRDAYDPDAVMRYQPGAWPEPGPFFGREAIMRQFDRLRDAFDYRDSLAIVGEPLTTGDRVVVKFTWKGAGYGPAVNMEAAVVYTVRGGRILEADFFRDHDEALEAAGLSE